MKKRILTVILCICLAFGGTIYAFAETSTITSLLGMLTGSESSGSINIAESFANMIKEESNKESTIDKMVNNIKNTFASLGSEDTENTENTDDTQKDVSVEIDKGAAANVAELFNLTVNELKKGTPGFTKNVTAGMSQSITQSLQGNAGVITGLIESIIGTKDIFAGALDGYNSGSETITTTYTSGNDIINNMSVSGKEYVACLTADDIKDYTVQIYSSGAYRMHIDLIDVEGSAADSGLSHVFDTSDKAYATIELGTTSININVLLKYTDCYVECYVNKKGEIISYTTYMGITFLFEQEDGTYSTVMPYFDVDFEEEEIIYTLTTEYMGFTYTSRPVGDANDDGSVNSTDARMVLRDASQLEALAEESVKYCDVNGDGVISAADARNILRAAAKLSELPTTEELLGITAYVPDQSVQNHIDDLLVLLLAYQAADEEEQKQLQNAYDSVYSEDSATEEETTTEINSSSEKIDAALDIITGIASGDLSSLTGILG